MDDIIVKLENLSKKYELGEAKIVALDNINLEILRGEFIIIMGPSGSGKSTMVNMIGGVDRPDSGSVTVFAKDRTIELHKLSDKELTRYRREKVGFVFQFYSLVPTLTVQENVEMIGELVGITGKQLKQRARQLLDEVGLQGRYDSFPSQLSGGERQRVALARALVKHPEILIVDEPTGQLDEETGQKMVKLMKETAKKYESTVVMVTHDVNLKKFGDRIIRLSSGRIVDQEIPIAKEA